MDGDEMDIDAMLEAPFRGDNEEENGENQKTQSDADGDRRKSSKKSRRSRSRSKERRRSRSRDRKKKRRSSRSRSRSRERRRGGRDRDRDKDKGRDRGKDRKRRSKSRSGSPPRQWSGYGFGRGYKGGSIRGFGFREKQGRKPRSLSKSPIREGTTQISKRDRYVNDHVKRDPVPQPALIEKDGQVEELSPEERDARTVFCMQLSPKIRTRDLEEFFSSVGAVRDVRIITDNKTGRSKGIAYIEFVEVETVMLALGLNGQKLLDYPINIQPTQAERNRLAAAQSSNASSLAALTSPTPIESVVNKRVPTKVYVGALHPNITEPMITDIFEPFGKIMNVELVKDKTTNKSKGFGFVTFQNGEEAQKAIDQLNGFELAGSAMRVHHLSEGQGIPGYTDGSHLDDMDRTGFNLGSTGRLQLMAKLAEGSGLQLPANAQQALQAAAASGGLPPQIFGALEFGNPEVSQPTVTTSCFLLSNMFDAQTTKNMGEAWVSSLRNYVIGECLKRGGCVHIYIDKGSNEGHVYVKSASIPIATATVVALHGHSYIGRVVMAAYVPENNYYMLFPEAEKALTILTPQ